VLAAGSVIAQALVPRNARRYAFGLVPTIC